MSENKERINIIDEYNKAINFLGEAMEECINFYPKHFKTIKSLWANYMYIYYEFERKNNKKFMRFIDYLYNFSNFIAKKYFPEEFNEDWRRPIKLESLINSAMFNRMEVQIREDPKFKEEIIKGLQTDPKIKDNPLTHLIEGLIAGEGFVSTIEVSEALDISHDSMLKKTQDLIDKKILLPERDYYQFKIDDF